MVIEFNFVQFRTSDLPQTFIENIHVFFILYCSKVSSIPLPPSSFIFPVNWRTRLCVCDSFTLCSVLLQAYLPYHHLAFLLNHTQNIFIKLNKPFLMLTTMHTPLLSVMNLYFLAFSFQFQITICCVPVSRLADICFCQQRNPAIISVRILSS